MPARGLGCVLLACFILLCVVVETLCAPPANSYAAPLDERVQRFNAWILPQLETNAIEVFVLDDGSGQIGARATRDIVKDEVYNVIPRHLLISTDTARACPTVGPIAKNIQADDFFLLLLFIIHERRLGDASPWVHYLALLPQSYAHHPLTFDASELEELQASPQRRIALMEQQRARHRFAQLTEKLTAVAGAIDSLGGPIDFEKEFVWAQGVLNSRRIWWSNSGHLVPLLDSINCRSDVGQRAHRTYAANDNGGLTRAPRSFKAGEEVFENYAQPNHIYFRYHGFSLEENPYDCVQVPMPNNNNRLACVPDKNGALFGLTKNDLKRLLSQYSTSIAQDKVLLEEWRHSSSNDEPQAVHRARMIEIIKFRLSEKKLLQQLIDQFEDKKDEL